MREHRLTRPSTTSRPTLLAFGLMAPLLAAVGCGEPSACVYVDNGGAQEMTVAIGGEPALVIPPGTHKAVCLAPGDYHFLVERGGESLYNGVRTLEESERLGFGREYVWNPGGGSCYASCKVEYGSETMLDFQQNATVTLAEAAFGAKADRLRMKFLQLKRYAEPMPAAEWFELPHGIQHVLQDAPDQVVTRGSTSTRRVLTRVPPQVREMLVQYQAVENPTQEDVDALALATQLTVYSLSEL